MAPLGFTDDKAVKGHSDQDRLPASFECQAVVETVYKSTRIMAVDPTRHKIDNAPIYIRSQR
jgi:hypothetical protein